MERTQEFPYGRCAQRGQPGSAHDDFTTSAFVNILCWRRTQREYERAKVTLQAELDDVCSECGGAQANHNGVLGCVQWEYEMPTYTRAVWQALLIKVREQCIKDSEQR